MCNERLLNIKIITNELMKKGIILFTFSLVMISCKTETKLAIKKENFPSTLNFILDKFNFITNNY